MYNTFDDQHNIMLTLDQWCIQEASNNLYDMKSQTIKMNSAKTAINGNKTHSENNAYIYYGYSVHATSGVHFLVHFTWMHLLQYYINGTYRYILCFVGGNCSQRHRSRHNIYTHYYKLT